MLSVAARVAARAGRGVSARGQVVVAVAGVLGRRALSDSITYSGGQASEGQGGFYGSGGSRVISGKPTHHPEALAQAADVATLSSIMAEVELLESELRSLGNSVTSRSIEIKSKVKKTISNPKVRDLLNRLELRGEPVWGLSREERALVRKVKEKYLSS